MGGGQALGSLGGTAGNFNYGSAQPNFYSGGTPLLGQTQQPNFWSGGTPLQGYSGGTPLQSNDPFGQTPLPQQPAPSDINDFFNRFFNFSGGAQPSLSGLGTKLQ